MKREFYLFLILSIFAIKAHSQVTIGKLDAPHRGAVLELKSDTLGFLPPRVTLSKLSLPDPLPIHVQGIVVFNLTDAPADTLYTGFYYNTGTHWKRLSSIPAFLEGWMYMPSIAFDVSQIGSGFTKDLYKEYKTQFDTPKKSSPGAPLSIYTIPDREDLYYYILDYDETVFGNVNVEANGEMSYDVMEIASDATYLNIVFLTKPSFW
jgi:hypothetical protein